MAENLDSIDVASYIVKFCAFKNRFINLTKLQKILYSCYGVFLSAFKEKLCKETPRAWEHGPVFPKVYDITSKNRDGFVQYLIEYDDKCRTNLSHDKIDVLNKTIDVFSQYSAGDLVRWSHLEGGPWAQTVEQKGLYKEINDDLIRDYFGSC